MWFSQKGTWKRVMFFVTVNNKFWLEVICSQFFIACKFWLEAICFNIVLKSYIKIYKSHLSMTVYLKIANN